MEVKFRPDRLVNYDDDTLLAEIRRVIATHFHGAVPTMESFANFSMVHPITISQRFGTWADAIRKAGFSYQRKPVARKSEISKDLMLADLQRTKELAGGIFFSRSFYAKNGGRYAPDTLTRHLGSSWNTILGEHLGLVRARPVRLKLRRQSPARVSEHSTESLFQELKRVWDELGRRPSYHEFRRLGGIGTGVYELRFGSWTSAIEAFFSQSEKRALGLPASHVTPQLLLEELARIVRDNNISLLTFNRYRKLGGSSSIGTFQAHFGSWAAAVKKAGCRDGHSGRYSDEELFSEIQRLWESLGRQPTWKDMNQHGSMSAKAFKSRFGGWTRAIHAFCTDRGSLGGNAVDPILPVGGDTESAAVVIALSREDSTPIEPAILCPPGMVLVDARRIAGRRLRFRVFQRDGFKCVACGRGPATHPGVALHCDHVIAWAKGGRTVLGNLQSLCEDCNLGKSDLPMESAGSAEIPKRITH